MICMRRRSSQFSLAGSGKMAFAQMRLWLCLPILLTACDTPNDRLQRITMEACKERGGVPYYHTRQDRYPGVTCEWPPTWREEKDSKEKKPQVSFPSGIDGKR
jgi:hypothetical protein